jgi:hypothetical protein
VVRYQTDEKLIKAVLSYHEELYRKSPEEAGGGGVL